MQYFQLAGDLTLRRNRYFHRSTAAVSLHVSGEVGQLQSCRVAVYERFGGNPLHAVWLEVFNDRLGRLRFVHDFS
jgi:hypothetical protein